MNTLDAVVVGCGYAGEQHARGFELAPGSRLAAVCDRDEKRAEALAARMGVPAFESLDEALAAVQPEIVSVATDEYHHVEPAVSAFRSGAHVFCEKMLAHSLEAAQRIVSTADEARRTLGVNFNYRHVPGYRIIRDSIEDGELRTPALVTINAHAYLWHHSLDLLRFLLGDPYSLQAVVVEDAQLRRETYHWRDHERLLYVPSASASAILRFESGTTANISASAHVPFAEHWFSISVYAAGGTLHLDHAVPSNLLGTIGEGPLQERLAELPPFTVEESFQQSISAFVEAVSKEQHPLTTGADGLASMEIEAAVARAARSGSTERLV